MMKPSNVSSPDMYLDFSQFNQMRKLSRDNEEQALQAAAKQMEGIFLNMMLQSMRDANAVFGEGNLFESKDSEFYQGMYDKQLTLDISNNGGIGLADVIVRQMSRQAVPGDAEAPNSGSPANLSRYLSHPVRALERQVEHQDRSSAVDSPINANPETNSEVAWSSPEQFVAAMYPHAKRAANDLGVSADAIMAQAILETGWGQHVMAGTESESSFNLFGIKADVRWDGDVTRKSTVEYRNGIAARENAAFRSYQSLGEAFDDYVSFLRSNQRYGNALSEKSEAKQWGFQLQKSGYATDPNYGNKIANIMDSDAFQSALNNVTKEL